MQILVAALVFSTDEDDHASTDQLIKGIESLVTDLKLPKTLSAAGVDASAFESIAEHVTHDFAIAGNPRKVTTKIEVIEILKAAL